MSKYTVPPDGNPKTADGHQTRRAALRALVSVGVLAIPAISASASALPDPIFGAIERHKATYEAALLLSFAIDDLINNPEARVVSEAEWDALERAHENENAAFDALLRRKGIAFSAPGVRSNNAPILV